ncbi:MAG: hypothetical protein L0Z50_06340 [Verrucomicrobiales bacterium]|nr:hypothetical protein [Verrucomicrobiales bacterium]
MGKAWDAVAGKTNNLAGGTGEIFLPLITPGTLQPVSVTQDTEISFPAGVVAANPALAGVTITVPANSLFSDDGTRGGKVGIAPVPPDRLPGPLPPGLEAPIVITIQTDGPLNFDKPAPVCFPNLPDPVLKAPLPAGSKQALVSFNHKKGIWEAVGSMTVSGDGKFICSDPGSGILQPGWHVAAPVPDGPPPCGEGLCCPEPDDNSQPIITLDGNSYPVRVGKAQPNPSSCDKPCPFKKLDECIHKCAVEFVKCVNYVRRAIDRCLSNKVPCPPQECILGDCDPGHCTLIVTEPICREYLENLYAKCLRIEQILGPTCQDEYRRCTAQCRDECPLAVAASATRGKAGLADDLIVDQIREKSEAVATLLAPYLASGAAIPQDVWEQVNALEEEANAIAGGDVLEFLDRYLAEQERELAEMDAQFGEDPGNAPPYPVLFAAEIERPGGSLTLRGETRPFGQYSIFVPRDGELLYVSFYDPRTKRIGVAFPHLRPGAPYRMPRFNLAPGMRRSVTRTPMGCRTRSSSFTALTGRSLTQMATAFLMAPKSIKTRIHSMVCQRGRASWERRRWWATSRTCGLATIW